MGAPHRSARDEAVGSGAARGAAGGGRAQDDGAIVHCFVDAAELRRLLALLVAAEMTTAMIHDALSG